ncbi:MAG: prepilin-type N-terminal cleavage/methylation domain-containing protein [Gemmataceae bacterium]
MSLRIRRSAFTLVELLVVMAIVVLLATLTLAVVVNMGERDGTTDAAGLTRQWLMIAKNRAARDHANRGLRLVVGLDSNNPAKTNALWVTELQYIEQPPTFVPTIANPTARPPYTALAPCVKIVYGYDAAGNQLQGSSECWIDNLEPGEAAFLQSSIPGGLLTLSDLRNSAETGPFTGRMFPPSAGAVLVGGTAPGTSRLRMRLDPFPIVPHGATGTPNTTVPQYMTFNFGITPPPQVIVGEPPLQLPKGICIDLTVSVPAVGTDVDILFTPSGHVVPMGSVAGVDGMILLWHRDYTKIPGLGSPLTVLSPGPPVTFDMTPFQRGGEQQLVSVRCKTGALGQFPVKWPNAAGQYNPGEDAYTFARTGATSP